MKSFSFGLNLFLLEFALNSLCRDKLKNSFIFVVFTLLVFIITSVFQISNGLKKEALLTVNSLPQITIQQLQSGRISLIDNKKIDQILQIDGVSYVNGRVWGYYYFAPRNIYFTVVGIDHFEEQYKNSFTKITSQYNFDTMENSIVVGAGVWKLLKESLFVDKFNFIKPNGEIKEVNIVGSFDRDTTFETNDIILMPKKLASDILNIKSSQSSDLTVQIKNQDEILMISEKIRTLLPDCKVYTQNELSRGYEEMFNYKSGLFLSIFIVSLFTFFMIIYDKINSISSEIKNEIGVLKAVGWSVNDILKLKFLESGIISVFAFCLGVFVSYVYIYILNAPLLKDIFLGYSELKPDFNILFELNFELLSIVFFLSVPIYIAASIFPTWRIASLDADEVLR